jgi:DNA polymerase-3 subunit alpha
MMPLEEAFMKQAKKVILRIFLPGIEETVFDELKKILDENRGDCDLLFELETPHSYRVLIQSAEIKGVTPSEKFKKDAESLLGDNSVFIEY